MDMHMTIVLHEALSNTHSPFLIWKEGNYICQTCKHFICREGVLRWREAENRPVIGCERGMFKLTHDLTVPLRVSACREYERAKEVKFMPELDLNGMSEEEIREKIREIRRERSGVSKRARTVAKRKYTKSGRKRRPIGWIEEVEEVNP